MSRFAAARRKALLDRWRALRLPVVAVIFPPLAWLSFERQEIGG